MLLTKLFTLSSYLLSSTNALKNSTNCAPSMKCTDWCRWHKCESKGMVCKNEMQLDSNGCAQCATASCVCPTKTLKCSAITCPRGKVCTMVEPLGCKVSSAKCCPPSTEKLACQNNKCNEDTICVPQKTIMNGCPVYHGSCVQKGCNGPFGVPSFCNKGNAMIIAMPS